MYKVFVRYKGHPMWNTTVETREEADAIRCKWQSQNHRPVYIKKEK